MTPSPEQEARAREVLFDHAASKPNWSLPEDKAVFSADTAIEAMLQFALSCVEAEREANGEFVRVPKGAVKALSEAFITSVLKGGERPERYISFGYRDAESIDAAHEAAVILQAIGRAQC